MKIKICGMREPDNIRQVTDLHPDYMGFIFWSGSPRNACQLDPAALATVPQTIRRVGVFVNESKENILMYTDRFGLDYIQLHGHEAPEYCRSLRNAGLHLIKAFSILLPKDLLAVSAYNGLCDYYLFDTKTPQYGGSGNQFDWNLLHRYNGPTPFLLSGGINPYSVKALREFRHPYFAGIDINSRFETAPGIKDVERISNFLKELKGGTI